MNTLANPGRGSLSLEWGLDGRLMGGWWALGGRLRALSHGLFFTVPTDHLTTVDRITPAVNLHIFLCFFLLLFED